MGYFWGWGKVQKHFFRSTLVGEQLSFSMFPSILTFEFDLIFGSFLNFWGPNGLFLEIWYGSTTVLGLLIAEQDMLSMSLSILAFYLV